MATNEILKNAKNGLEKTGPTRPDSTLLAGITTNSDSVKNVLYLLREYKPFLVNSDLGQLGSTSFRSTTIASPITSSSTTTVETINSVQVYTGTTSSSETSGSISSGITTAADKITNAAQQS